MAEVVKCPHFSEMGYRLQILPGSKELYSFLENVVINVTPVVTILSVFTWKSLFIHRN